MADDKKADADRIKWLTKEIWSNINCLDERAGFNTKKAFIVKIASIVLGTITTITAVRFAKPNSPRSI